MTLPSRLNWQLCARLAMAAERVQNRRGKVSLIVYRWAERYRRSERQVWRWLEIGRVVMSVKRQ